MTTGKVKFPDTLLQRNFVTLPVSNHDVVTTSCAGTKLVIFRADSLCPHLPNKDKIFYE